MSSPIQNVSFTLPTPGSSVTTISPIDSATQQAAFAVLSQEIIPAEPNHESFNSSYGMTSASLSSSAPTPFLEQALNQIDTWAVPILG